MKLQNLLLRLSPMWECENCGNIFKKEDNQRLTCVKCGGKRKPPSKDTIENTVLTFFSKLANINFNPLKTREERSQFAHHILAPKLKTKQRQALFVFFTILFESGWENSGGNDPTDGGAWTGTSGSPTVVDTPVHHGSYALKIDADEYVRKDLAASYATLHTRLYIRFSALPWAQLYNSPFLYLGASTNWAFSTHIEAYNYDGTNCHFRIYDDGTASSSEGTTIIQLLTWYAVELKRVTGSGSSLMLIDDTQEASVAYGYYDANRVQVGGAFSLDSVGYIDCVVVADVPIGLEIDISTKNATEIFATTAKLNGNAGLTHYARGFQWGKQTGNYTDDWSETNSFGAGDFSRTIETLDKGTTYYFRAMLKETAEGEWFYGGEKFFATLTVEELFIQTYSEGAGKKKRYYQRTVSANVVYEQTMRMSQAPTYLTANLVAQTHAQNLHFISLFNGAGSGKKVVIKDIKWRNGKLTAITNPTAIEMNIIKTTAQGSNGTTLTPQKFDSTNSAIPAQITALQAPSTPPTEGSTLLPFFINQEELIVASEWAYNIFSNFGRIVRKTHCQQIVLNEGEGITIKEISAPNTPAGASSFYVLFNLV